MPFARLAWMIVLAAGVVAPAATASAAECGTLTLEFENDRVAETDRNFTHGMFATWVSPRDALVPGWADSLAKAVPTLRDAKYRRVAYTVGQSIFTPDNLQARSVVADDRPYAGWLYAGASLVGESPERLDRLSLQAGVIGPEAAADEVQTEFHKRIKATIPKGWGNQLDTEPGLVLFYETKWRELIDLDATGGTNGLGLELSPHVAAAAGNVFTYAAVGGSLRFGDDLADDFGPPRIRPGVPGANFFTPRDAFAWNVFVGVEARAVARNIFLDGNTFSESHSVDKRRLVFDAQAGLALRVHGVRLTFTHVIRSHEFDEQDELSAFGAVSLSVRF